MPIGDEVRYQRRKTILALSASQVETHINL
jgi:hypothetical protein